MVNPFHRPKHLQSKIWFRVCIDGFDRVVRPVDGESWFNEPGLSFGVIHLIDEFSDRVGVVETWWFDKHATRVAGYEEG